MCGRCGQALGLLLRPGQLAARYPSEGWRVVPRPMPDRPLCDLDGIRPPQLRSLPTRATRKPTSSR